MGYKLIACDLDETLLNDEHLVGAKMSQQSKEPEKNMA